MTKVLSIAILILFINISLSLSQEAPLPAFNSTVFQANLSIEELENEENQRINKDEGYGSNDAEYYNAEGVNSQDNEEDEEGADEKD